MQIQIARSMREIDPGTWDRLGGGAFQSHRWYTFAERVMSDCAPTYLLACEDGDLTGRAALWQIRNEPLPKLPAPVRALFEAALRRWPLLVCRSPFSNASGLVLTDGPRRGEALSALTDAALTEARQQGASFVMFDFLTGDDLREWPSGFATLSMFSPGTVMESRWHNLEEYLAAAEHKKTRRQYKSVLRETGEQGVRLSCLKAVPDAEAAVALVRKVERKHGSPPNPWMQALLEHMPLVDGTWLEARIGDRLVGNMLVLEDGDGQTTTALGLAEDVSHVYFLILFTALDLAFQKGTRFLRWGSGAYEAKRRLGFELEHNNSVAIRGTGPVTQFITHLASQR